MANHLPVGLTEELYKRAPRYAVRGGSVLDRITQCVDQFIGQKVETGEYEAARKILSGLQEEYGAEANQTGPIFPLANGMARMGVCQY